MATKRPARSPKPTPTTRSRSDPAQRPTHPHPRGDQSGRPFSFLHSPLLLPPRPAAEEFLNLRNREKRSGPNPGPLRPPVTTTPGTIRQYYLLLMPNVPCRRTRNRRGNFCFGAAPSLREKNVSSLHGEFVIRDSDFVIPSHAPTTFVTVGEGAASPPAFAATT
jgi:hypothetical protein